MKYFTVALPESGTRIWMFLWNIRIIKKFKILIFNKISISFTATWPNVGTGNSKF